MSRPLHPKLEAGRKARGPHLICYRCDWPTITVEGRCETCDTLDFVFPCNGRCVYCESGKPQVRVA